MLWVRILAPDTRWKLGIILKKTIENKIINKGDKWGKPKNNFKLNVSNNSFSRNSPVSCDVFPPINFQLWKTDNPALQVPEAILLQTLEKGTQGLALRRKEEYKLWENSEFC